MSILTAVYVLDQTHCRTRDQNLSIAFLARSSQLALITAIQLDGPISTYLYKIVIYKVVSLLNICIVLLSSILFCDILLTR